MDFTVRELFHPDNKEKHVTHAQRSVFDRPIMMVLLQVQSGASSRSKIGGAYFSDVAGSIQDPIAVPGPCEVTEF